MTFPYTSEAIVYQGRKNGPYVDEYTIESIKPNEILIKTAYASINPVDVKLHAFTITNKVYHTLHDFSGVVVQVGSQAAATYSIGEKVYGSLKFPGDERFIGSYTVLDVSADKVGKLPSTLGTKEGAALGIAYGTAYDMVERADGVKKLGPDSKVLVLGGATSVGSYVIEILKKQYNVGYVAVTCSPSSSHYTKEYGADDFISYVTPSLSDDLVKFVQSKGFKFDSILDTVGGREAIAVYDKILVPLSEHNSYVTIQGDSAPASAYSHMFFNYLIGIPTSVFRHFFGKYLGINYQFVVYSSRTSFAQAESLFSKPGVKVPIDSVYPADDIKSAWHKVDSTKAKGKVLIKFN